MPDYNEILQQIPMDELASILGVDEATARAATQEALPALLGGLQANAADPDGAASLASALGGHGGLLDGGLDLAQVDTSDGQAILGNIFGSNTDAVMNQLGGYGAMSRGGGSSLISRLLPLLAPIVMAWLAKKVQGGLGGQGGGATSPSAAQTQDQGGVLGSGQGSSPAQQDQPAQPAQQDEPAQGDAGASNQGLGSGGGILGQILGGVLGGAGGGTSSGGGGAGGDILGQILGGLLGGGKR